MNIEVVQIAFRRFFCFEVVSRAGAVVTTPRAIPGVAPPRHVYVSMYLELARTQLCRREAPSECTVNNHNHNRNRNLNRNRNGSNKQQPTTNRQQPTANNQTRTNTQEPTHNAQRTTQNPQSINPQSINRNQPPSTTTTTTTTTKGSDRLTRTVELFLCSQRMAAMAAALASGAVQRRRERRLRSWLRHERQTVAMVLAEACHYSSRSEGGRPRHVPSPTGTEDV